MESSGKHTIVLMQLTKDKRSRTFMDYDTITLAMNGVCQVFEKQLKELNPQMPNITYDINDLYTFIDNVPDLSCLVHEAQMGAYVPYTKAWIKKRVYMLLKKQAS